MHCPRCGPGSLALLGDHHAGDAPLPGREPDRAAELARALGRQYRVIRLLGRGGFAEVYEVRDQDLQRRLAVKLLRTDLLWSPATLARFKQEARAVARLSHPNILPIHFVRETEGLLFYVMPFCEGRTLTDILRAEGALPPGRALALAEPILQALQHAHEHGLVHRDVKPDNILIESDSGRPLLVDFGIAKDLAGAAGQTQTGYIVGTPLYMSPEQALGQEVDARADIYGMGVVLYHMLTGSPPFEGADSQEIVTRHVHQPVPLATLSRDRVPPWLTAVVLRCLAKHPDDRYPGAQAVLEALADGKEGHGALTPPAATAQPAARSGEAAWVEEGTITATMPRVGGGPRRRHALAALGLVAAGALWASSRPRLPAGPEPAEPAPVSLTVANRLMEPIAVTLDDTGLTVGPGDSVRLPVRSRAPLEVQWAMVQPTTASGAVLGRPVEGTFQHDDPKGELREVVTAGAGGVPRFLPVVVNATGRRVAVAVIQGGDTVDCRCRLQPGDSIGLGYWPLDRTSAVRVTDAGHAVARYNAMLTGVDSITGVMLVRVSRRALVSPLPSERKPPARRDPRSPLQGFLPVPR
ncbi:MAG TPA: serine/threonine-protein kinase [Gemmatimonadales bacterium]|nr:serine/threonine-protein kinase [Gemmatimonadales bacterium]